MTKFLKEYQNIYLLFQKVCNDNFQFYISAQKLKIENEKSSLSIKNARFQEFYFTILLLAFLLVDIDVLDIFWISNSLENNFVL